LIVPSTIDHPSDQPQETTVGNYFVANYPPFSFWSQDRCDEPIEALSKTPQDATPLGVYVHIPFCRKRCHFCYFRVYTGDEAKNDRVSQYVESVLREVQMYADRPLVQGRLPRFVYFGGGTPSALRLEQIEQLFSGLQSCLPWDEVEEVTFECEPGTLTPKKLELLRDLGVTRLSLGIENFNDAILKANNRGHLEAHAWRAREWARDLGFPQINIDLIAGMVNETEENWRDCIRKTIELAPDCVTIYQMEVTFNSIIYKQMKERGEIVAPVADWPTKRAWVSQAFDALEDAGYTVTSGYTAVKDPDDYKFLYRDYLWRGADMVSLGVSSFGHFSGTHYQNEAHIGPYMDRLKQGEFPIHRALTMTEDEKLLRELILQLKLGYLDSDYFRRKFGVDILNRFADAIRQLKEQQLMTIDDGQLRLTRRGLLEIDVHLPQFFLPEHRDARYT
jgi:oxygen-independent coproporphyrinogen-3 oxidase